MIHLRNSHIIRSITQIVQLSLIGWLTACGGESALDKTQGNDPTATQSEKGAVPPAHEIWLTTEQERLAELHLDTARMQMVGDELLLNGLLEVPPQHYASLS